VDIFKKQATLLFKNVQGAGATAPSPARANFQQKIMREDIF